MNDANQTRDELAWTTGSGLLPYALSKNDFLQIVYGVVEFYREEGLDINNQCRIYKSLNVAENLVTGNYGARFYMQKYGMHGVQQALIDIFQFSSIFRFTRHKKVDEEFRKKAIRLTSDSLSPTFDRTETTPGRDTQFELFCCAQFNFAGAKTRLGVFPEPDLMIEIGPTELGADAKRIKSERQIEKRARKAKLQFSRVSRNGIFISDLSHIFNSLIEASDANTYLEKIVYDFMYARLNKVRAASSTACIAWVAFVQTASLSDQGIGFPFLWKTFGLWGSDDFRFYVLAQHTDRLSRMYGVQDLLQKDSKSGVL